MVQGATVVSHHALLRNMRGWLSCLLLPGTTFQHE
jgi:hypothetical protein